MKQLGRILSIVFPCVTMLTLILDSKTALLGAQEGLELCVRTIIPSLFPFFAISILLTGSLSGQEITILKPISKFCKMPKGTEDLLIVGLLGGYPVGAKCVYDAWQSGHISKKDALRCLGFCSNAGPAFIFGICSMLFSEAWITWILWEIHILSALLVGNLLPYDGSFVSSSTEAKHTSLIDAMAKSISAMAGVCGWVVLFRVVIAFAQRWFLWILPMNWQLIFEGVLELANGCTDLVAIENEGIRFILCACFLSFGGLCVGLQTLSVVDELGSGMYFPGKVMQCAISGCIASLFASIQYHVCSLLLPAAVTIVLLLLIGLKKTVDFPKRLVYNVIKDRMGGLLCYSERELQNPAAIVQGELE